MRNKRGVIGVIIFFAILLGIIVFGFIASVATGILSYASDEITPIMEDIGMVDQTNVSEVSRYTFGIADDFVQAMPWLIGLGYVAALVFSVVFVVSYGYNPNPALMGFYFLLMILIIFGAIILSNMYEDIYTGTDEIALKLQEQTLVSYMILYSPAVMIFISLIAGIYMFAGRQNEIGGFAGV